MNRTIFTFLICVLIATVFWLLTALSKIYTISTSFRLNYKVLPSNTISIEALPKQAQVDLRATGFRLIKHLFWPDKNVLTIDSRFYSKSNDLTKPYILLEKNIDDLGRQLGNNYKLSKISPDTIYLSFKSKKTKSVPVHANVLLSFEEQYRLSDSIRIIPNLIELSGPEELLSKIKYVRTSQLQFNDLNKTEVKRVALEMIDGVEFQPSSVSIEMLVEKYTEKTIELPITAINNPPSIAIKFFPDKVTIKCLVSIKNYETTKSNQFQAVVDYKKINENTLKAKVDIVKYPSYLKQFKTYPEKVEYIIKK